MILRFEEGDVVAKERPIQTNMFHNLIKKYLDKAPNSQFKI